MSNLIRVAEKKTISFDLKRIHNVTNYCGQEGSM